MSDSGTIKVSNQSICSVIQYDATVLVRSRQFLDVKHLEHLPCQSVSWSVQNSLTLQDLRSVGVGMTCVNVFERRCPLAHSTCGWCKHYVKNMCTYLGVEDAKLWVWMVWWQLEIMGDNPATVDLRKDLFDTASQSKYIRGMILRYWKTPVAGFNLLKFLTNKGVTSLIRVIR